MIKIAIVEDEEKEIEGLRTGIETFLSDAGEEYSADVFHDGMEFLDAERGNYDVVFMDIEMPKLDGYKTARRLREKDTDASLIFVTNLSQYAVRGYEVDAIGFIVKPVTYYALSVYLAKAVAKAKSRGASVRIATRGGVRIVPTDSISYVEVMLHTVVYHTENGDISVRGTLKDAEDKLSGYGFSKCNVCYLVNLKYVKSVTDDAVKLPNAELALSRGRKKNF